MKCLLYTDGGARGNPGPAATGVVVYQTSHDGDKKIASFGRYLGTATNNQAEYQAIIDGLQKAQELNCTHVDARLDSELAVKQINGEYKVKNPDLAKKFLEVHNLKQQFTQTTFTHIRREHNKEADEQVNIAIDNALALR